MIHGRGTGAVRKAVRDELAKHPLVEEQVSDSADGATVVRLGGVELERRDHRDTAPARLAMPSTGEAAERTLSPEEPGGRRPG